ncbi:MAG: CotH kinase family protein [Lachnospiraceae bacterium]|nr:CotH kinase family protein [Lachnospiraceae bacterium]
MVYRMRRHGILLLFVVFLTAVVMLMEKDEYNRVQREGNYMENLRFVLGNSASEQTIACFTEQEGRTSYLFLPSYARPDAVKISFAGAESVVFAGESGEIALKNGGSISELHYGEDYELYFCDRKGERLAQHKIVVMHSAGLPAVFLETDSGSVKQINADKNYAEKGRIVLFDADGSVVCADRLERISGRGNSTWAYSKKSYGIRLKNRADLFDMGSADKWILLSNVEDRSYLRNKITYDMGVAAGMEGSPESRYVDLYVNHRYHGMYQLCEKVEIDPERLPIADLEAANKSLNRDIESCGRFENERQKGVALLAEPRDLTGGYLLERDVVEKFREEISGFYTETLKELYTVKEPAYASAAQVDYISGLVNGMERAVSAEDGVDPENGMHYTDYIDLRSFAQKYIVEELCKNNGAGATSSFFYKPDDSVSKKLFAGPVWDYDKAYANLTGINESTKDLCYMMQRGTDPTTLFWHLNRHEEFRQMVSACYGEFFADYIQTIQDEKIDGYVSEISASKDMDLIRWKEIYGESVDYEGEVQRIRDFLSARKPFLDEVWTKQREVCTVGFFSEEGGITNYMGVIKGERLERLPGEAPGTQDEDRIFDGWYTEDGVLFDGTEPVEENITVYARSHEISGTE